MERTRAPVRPPEASRFAAERWSQRGEASEREAEELAHRALTRGSWTTAAAGAPGGAPGGAAGAVGGDAPAGRGLTDEERAFFEPRFDCDFSRIRLFSGSEAARAARSAGALAYTLGERIVWGAPVTLGIPAGRVILAHELAHTAAGHTAAEPRTAFRQEATSADMPTAAQQRDVMAIFNPQQSAGADVPSVQDADAFVTELKDAARTLRAQSLTYATRVSASPVSLSTGDLDSVTTLAEEEIGRSYGAYLGGGIDLSRVRARLRYIPADPGTSPAADEANLSQANLESLARSAVRIKVAQDDTAQEIIRRHHVLPGGRDRALYQRALGEIHDEAPAEWRSIALTFRGWNMSSATLLQRRIVPARGESNEQARRRGRWLNLGTSIHEMLHASTHADFTTAVGALEQRELGVEGFTEFFTRRLYGELVTRAASDVALRARIEGAEGPAFTPPERTSYTEYFHKVEEILAALGGNLENLRQAYFRGRVEYIGLGSWNELARGLPTARRHEIGVAALLRVGSGGTLVTDSPFARVSYGYLVWGHSGAVQLDLRAGAGLTYMGEGQRLGLGPELSLMLRGGNLFLHGAAAVQGSTAVTGAGLEQGRVDSIFRLYAGAQIGRFQIGPGLEVLVPIDNAERAREGTRVFAGIGASFVFGR